MQIPYYNLYGMYKTLHRQWMTDREMLSERDEEAYTALEKWYHGIESEAWTVRRLDALGLIKYYEKVEVQDEV